LPRLVPLGGRIVDKSPLEGVAHAPYSNIPVSDGPIAIAFGTRSAMTRLALVNDKQPRYASCDGVKGKSPIFVPRR
jgi:hypothetical protein